MSTRVKAGAVFGLVCGLWLYMVTHNEGTFYVTLVTGFAMGKVLGESAVVMIVGDKFKHIFEEVPDDDS